VSASLTPPPGGSPSPGGPTPGTPPPGGGAQPPIGSSTATGPSQNLGATAQGNQIVTALVQLMAAALTKLPPGTPLAKAVSKAHFEISKEIEPGTASPAGVSNAMKTMALQQNRMRPQIGAQATQTGAPGGAVAPPTPPPAAAAA
jgi:hypothetical protein